MYTLVRVNRPELTDPVAAELRAAGIPVVSTSPRFNTIMVDAPASALLDFASHRDVDRIFDREIKAHVTGAFSRPDRVITSDGVVGQSWGPARMIRREAPWLDAPNLPFIDTFTDLQLDGEGVDIYIIDTGLDESHVEFDGRATLAFYNSGANMPPAGYTDGNGHGTAVGSAAAGNNSGLATGALLWGFKASTGATSSEATTNTFTAALEAAIAHYESRRHLNRPCIVNMSWSGPVLNLSTHYATMAKLGMILVATAANGNQMRAGVYPGSSAFVLNVGGTSAQDYRYDTGWGGTNFGPDVDIYAPGQRMMLPVCSYVAGNNSSYQLWNGTSFSAPSVAGVLACMLTGKPAPQNEHEVAAVIKQLLDTSLKTKMRRRQIRWDQMGMNRMAYFDPTAESYPDAGSIISNTPEPDIAYPWVALLLQLQDPDGTTITDTGPDALVPVSVTGTSVIDNSITIEGAGQYVEYAASDKLALGKLAAAWAIEVDIRIDELPSASDNMRILHADAGTVSSPSWSLRLNASGSISMITSLNAAGNSHNTLTVIGTAAYTLGERFRLKVSFDGMDLHTFKDGHRMMFDTSALAAQVAHRSALLTPTRLLVGNPAGLAYTAGQYTIFGVRITHGAHRGYDVVEEVLPFTATPADRRYVGYTSVTTSTNATTRATTIPVDTLPGDLLVMSVASWFPPVVPAGWTLVNSSAAEGDQSLLHMLSRVAEVGDAGASVTVTQPTTGLLQIVISAFRKTGGFTLRGSANRSGIGNMLSAQPSAPVAGVHSEPGDLVVTAFTTRSKFSSTGPAALSIGLNTVSSPLSQSARLVTGYSWTRERDSLDPIATIGNTAGWGYPASVAAAWS